MKAEGSLAEPGEGTLRTRAAHSSVITVVTQGAVFVLGLSSTIILARLLTPREFGLVAMANTLTALLRVFRDSGLSIATIQKEGITQAQVSNLFWANIIVGAVITILVASLSPAIVLFYGEPKLSGITLWLSLTFVISSIAVQPRAMLQRAMRFRDLGLVDISSSAISLITGVAMARSGFGYWSLVGLQLSTVASDLILTTLMARWRPHLPKRQIGTRGLLKFGASLTLSSFLRQVAQSSDTILVGKYCGPISTGLYSRGLALLLRPVQQFLQPLESVFLPVLSRVQSDPARYRRVFLKAYGAITLLSLPLAGLLFGLSDLVVKVFLGDRWLGVIPIFQWLTLAALAIPIGNSSMWVLTTQGRSRDILATGILFSILTIAAFLIGVRFGPVGVAVAYALSWIFLRLPIQYFIIGRNGIVTTWDLWKVPLLNLPVGLAAASGTYLFRHIIAGGSNGTQLALSALSGIACCSAFVFGIPQYRKEALFLLESLQRKPV